MISIFGGAICLIGLFLIIPQLWHENEFRYEREMLIINMSNEDFEKLARSLADKDWQPSEKTLSAAKKLKTEGY